ncbi:GNAT family N-acetyltransferase [Mycolicibacterium neworleansense]|uniref:Acetyltransferase, gnat family protein n=1 Tax=Mycolicibacterium neworleansense TaxID=146018 RepID=A0A0H5RIH6_9MYCO|nr:GNAT family N-acetyltransferase [Mycolicibacterium neworleansense]MCV7362026.1 GNAT family N-acetyltransferase [Mycolicibacterium neworleansense]CRZ13566.1 acetyltransferase, gnat family protein [Mycolicibacterium neworleansense]
MTLTEDALTSASIVTGWTVAEVTARHHPLIADFLATTPGIGGRKFAADSRDVAEQLSGAYPGSAVVLVDEAGAVAGYAALHRPDGAEPEVLGNFVFGPDAPADTVRGIVDDSVGQFGRVAVPGAYLRVFIGADQAVAIDALTARGARRERQFSSTLKVLNDEDPAVLAEARIDSVSVLSWPEVVAAGLTEQVRQVQFDTFREHFGNMSKTPQRWEHHLASRAFTPDFSLAAVDDDGVVIGYVLGSTYTSGTGADEIRSAHTDYIGVRADRRKAGTAELLLRKLWLAALRRGLTHASLGTDIANASNAHLLYARLGYRTVRDEYAYRIDAEENS